MSKHSRNPEIKTVNQAARYGDKEAVWKLIEKGHPVDVADNRGWRPTHEAVDGNHIECLNILLKNKNTKVNWQSFEGYSALLIASKHGFTECVRILLDHGADPNQDDSMEQTPLHAAISALSMECIKLVVEKKADVNSQIYCGTTPLHQIIQHQNATDNQKTEIIRYLLDNGAKLDVCEEYNISPIFTAAHLGFPSSLKILLQEADKRDQSHLRDLAADDGAVPIFLASQEGHSECVRLLLEHGANPNITTKRPHKVLPLHAAVQFKHTQCVDLLLQKLDSSALSHCDIGLWEYAITQSSGIYVKKLINHGLDINIKEKQNMCSAYVPEAFRSMIGFYHVTFNEPTKAIFTAAVNMITENKSDEAKETLRLILDANAIVNTTDPYDIHPLLPIIETNCPKSVELMIRHGSILNIYHPKIKGNLAILCSLPYPQITNLLLACGAEPGTLFRSDCEESFCDSDSAFHSHQDSYEVDFGSLLISILHLLQRNRITIGPLLQKLMYFSANVDVKMIANVLEQHNVPVRYRKDILATAENPRSLMHYSRLVVRQSLSPANFLDNLQILDAHVPKMIKGYLQFSDIFSEGS